MSRLCRRALAVQFSAVCAALADVLRRLARGISLAKDLPALVPAAWLQAHPDAAVPALNLQQVSRFNE